MKLKRLTIDDLGQLKELVNAKASINSMLNDFESSLVYRSKWIEGMQRWYLPESDTHYLYGNFDNNGKLISCMAWRCDLPNEWSDGWVVGHLKSRPGNSIRTNGIVEIWDQMFKICEGKGLKRWHMVIPEGNSRRYQAVADRYFKEVDSSYEYTWSLIVPPKTKPKVDWVWATMGRTLLNTEIRVRTGTKKCAQN